MEIHQNKNKHMKIHRIKGKYVLETQHNKINIRKCIRQKEIEFGNTSEQKDTSRNTSDKKGKGSGNTS